MKKAVILPSILILIILASIYIFGQDYSAQTESTQQEGKGEVYSVKVSNISPSSMDLNGIKIDLTLSTNGEVFQYHENLEIYLKNDWESLSSEDNNNDSSTNKVFLTGVINDLGNDTFSVDVPLNQEGDYVLAIKCVKDEKDYYVTTPLTLTQDTFSKISEDRATQAANAEAEQQKAEETEKIRPFNQTISKLDPIIKNLDVLNNQFNDPTNWYEGNPINNNEALNALTSLESTDTTPLAAILVNREKYELAEKLSQLSMGINDMKNELTNSVRLSYFPTDSSNRKADIQKSKQLLLRAQEYVNTYQILKTEVESGNIK